MTDKENSYVYYYTRNGKQFMTPSIDLAIKRSEEGEEIKVVVTDSVGQVTTKVLELDS